MNEQTTIFDAIAARRLNEISEEDAIAEGVNDWSSSGNSARYKFLSLWDRINGKREGCSWADSPWVWVVEFRKLEANDEKQ